jgi:glutamate--cysteine ligase
MTPLLPILSPRIEDALAHPDCLESLKGMRFGLEKEGLRVDKDTGALAPTPHAEALGSALTHPHITTDYSEALLEFVTATYDTPRAALAELESLQAYSATVLGNERIWPLSMPCLLPESDSDIPLAYYGESHLGRLKTVYRRGLGFRYGRQMQTIAGVHFNLSWSDAFWHWRATLDGHKTDQDSRQIRDTGYFHTIRNYRRIQWLFMLLTGASPAVDASFRLLAMDRFKIANRTRIAADATSLRMSDLGYQSAAQESINICFNHLDTYCETLARAVHQPWPTYEGLGLKDEAGFKQLNTAVLQIENEYYSSIRPKRVQQAAERPVRALINRGVEYLEIRAIDLNPYARNGISETEACLITLLMTACAVAESPHNSDEECVAISGLNARATWAGRRDSQHFDTERTFRKAGLDVLASLDGLAEVLDRAQATQGHTDALQDARVRLQGDCPLLSEEVEASSIARGHLEFGLAQAELHHHNLIAQTTPEGRAEFARLASDSLRTQQDIESQDQGSFDDFVTAFINQP